MNYTIIVVCAIFIASGIHFCATTEYRESELDEMFGIDTTGYIDPHHNIGKARKHLRKNQNENHGTSNCEQSCLECKERKALLEEKLAEMKEECKDHKTSSSGVRCEYIFLKRYVKQILNLFTSQNSDSVHLIGHLDGENRRLLENFINGNGHDPSFVDSIISSVLSPAPSIPEKPSHDSGFYFDHLPPVNSMRAALRELLSFNVVFPTILLVLLVVLLFGLARQWNMYIFIFYCGASFLLVSTLWHWHHMYLKVVAQRRSDSMKLQAQLPVHCTPERMARLDYVITSIKSIFGSLDDCEKFHESMLIDPIWEVSPTLALSETIGIFILHPLGILGKGLGFFFKQLYAIVPLKYLVPVSIIVVTLLIVSLLVMCGYELNFPFWMGSIRPSYPSYFSVSPPVVQQEGSHREMVEVLQSIAQRPQAPINVNINFGPSARRDQNETALANLLGGEDERDSAIGLARCIQYGDQQDTNTTDGGTPKNKSSDTTETEKRSPGKKVSPETSPGKVSKELPYPLTEVHGEVHPLRGATARPNPIERTHSEIGFEGVLQAVSIEDEPHNMKSLDSSFEVRRRYMTKQDQKEKEPEACANSGVQEIHRQTDKDLEPSCPPAYELMTASLTSEDDGFEIIATLDEGRSGESDEEAMERRNSNVERKSSTLDEEIRKQFPEITDIPQSPANPMRKSLISELKDLGDL